jgi:DNA gyrase/topoisomerase IV subunit A
LAAIELGEKIINAFETNENNIENILVIASKKCFIKRTKMASLINKIVKFSTIMSLNEGDELVSCILSSSNNTDDLIGVITTTGKGLMYPITQVSIVGKNASGVVNTKGAEDIAAIFIDSPKKNYLFIGGVQGCKMIKRDLIPIGKRTNNPKPLVNVLKVNSLQVLNAFMVNKDEEMIFLYDDNK